MIVWLRWVVVTKSNNGREECSVPETEKNGAVYKINMRTQGRV